MPKIATSMPGGVGSRGLPFTKCFAGMGMGDEDDGISGSLVCERTIPAAASRAARMATTSDILAGRVMDTLRISEVGPEVFPGGRLPLRLLFLRRLQEVLRGGNEVVAGGRLLERLGRELGRPAGVPEGERDEGQVVPRPRLLDGRELHGVGEEDGGLLLRGAIALAHEDVGKVVLRPPPAGREAGRDAELGLG